MYYVTTIVLIQRAKLIHFSPAVLGCLCTCHQLLNPQDAQSRMLQHLHATPPNHCQISLDNPGPPDDSNDISLCPERRRKPPKRHHSRKPMPAHPSTHVQGANCLQQHQTSQQVWPHNPGGGLLGSAALVAFHRLRLFR